MTICGFITSQANETQWCDSFQPSESELAPQAPQSEEMDQSMTMSKMDSIASRNIQQYLQNLPARPVSLEPTSHSTDLAGNYFDPRQIKHLDQKDKKQAVAAASHPVVESQSYASRVHSDEGKKTYAQNARRRFVYTNQESKGVVYDLAGNQIRRENQWVNEQIPQPVNSQTSLVASIFDENMMPSNFSWEN